MKKMKIIIKLLKKIKQYEQIKDGMKTQIIILIFLIISACNSSKEIIKNKEKITQSYFKINGVYSELTKNNYRNLYFFNSENNTVYFSKFKINDTLNKVNKPILKISVYGEYEIEDNIIKIQQDIEKKVKVSNRNFLENIVFTFPLPAPRAAKREITVIDKEIITEGKVKQDTIFINKMYVGTKKLNFKKKKTSKTHTINFILIYEPKFKGVIKKNSIYNNYEVQIIAD
jgi:hypothetical protein